jgi:uncharacterized protein YndB with AHSA1/START domain
MATVHFTVTRDLNLPARAVFDALIDWRGHAAWVPLTRVRILAGDGGPGTEFVATSGTGPFALPDRMRVDELDPVAMTVRITKIGPVLTGLVELAVTSTGDATSRLAWVEDIRVPVLPQFLAPPVAAAARRGFGMSITRMARLLAAGHPARGRRSRRGDQRQDERRDRADA